MPRSERREEKSMGWMGWIGSRDFNLALTTAVFPSCCKRAWRRWCWGCWWEWWDWEMVSRCLAVDYAVFSAAFSLARWYCCMNICCSRHLHNINNAVLQPFFSLNSPSTNGKKKNSKALLFFFWMKKLTTAARFTGNYKTVRKKSLF